MSATILSDHRAPGRTTLRIHVEGPGVLVVVQHHATRDQPMTFSVEMEPGSEPVVLDGPASILGQGGRPVVDAGKLADALKAEFHALPIQSAAPPEPKRGPGRPRKTE